MAQQAVGQGGIQANNAILGLPVDMSFANNPQQVETDYSGINNAQMPLLGSWTQESDEQAALTQSPQISNTGQPERMSENIGFRSMRA